MESEANQQLKAFCKMTGSGFSEASIRMADVFNQVDQTKGEGPYQGLGHEEAVDQLASNARKEITCDINSDLVLKDLLIKLIGRNLQIEITGSRVTLPVHSSDYDFNLSSKLPVSPEIIFDIVEDMIGDEFDVKKIRLGSKSAGHLHIPNTSQDQHDFCMLLRHKTSDLTLSFALNPEEMNGEFRITTSRRKDGKDTRIPGVFTSSMSLTVDREGNIKIDDTEIGSKAWRDSVFVSPKGNLVYGLGMENTTNLGFTQAFKIWKELKKARVDFFVDSNLEERLKWYRLLVNEQLFAEVSGTDSDLIFIDNVSEENLAFHKEYVDVGSLIALSQILYRLKDDSLFETNLFSQTIISDLKKFSIYNDAIYPDELRILAELTSELKVLNQDNAGLILQSIDNVLKFYKVDRSSWHKVFSNQGLLNKVLLFQYPLNFKLVDNYSLKFALNYEKAVLFAIIAIEAYTLFTGDHLAGESKFLYKLAPLVVLLHLAMMKYCRNGVLKSKQAGINEVLLKDSEKKEGNFYMQKNIRIKKI